VKGRQSLISFTAQGGDFQSLTARLRLEVLCRQWEIAELIRDMVRAESTVAAMEALASAGPAFRLTALYYRSVFLKLSASHQEAKEELERGLAIADEIGSDRLRAKLLYVLGNVHYNLSDFQSAIDIYREALRLHGSSASAIDRMRVLGDIGLAFWKMGRYEQALETFAGAELLARESNDVRNAAVFRTNKAGVLLVTDRVEAALELYREALDTSQRIGDFQNRSTLYNNIGAILIRQGHYRQAAEMLEEGIDLDRMAGAAGNLTGKLNNLAILRAMFGETAQARKLFAEALEIDRQSGNLNSQMMRLCNMADLSMMLDDVPAALEQISEAIGISRRIGAEAYLAHNLAVKADICLTAGMNREALEAAEEALSIAERAENTDNRVHALIMLAYARSASGLMDGALESSARAEQLIEAGGGFEMAPERVYLCRYDVLAQAGRGEEGRPLRDRAVALLMKKADEIADPGKRAQFLESNGVYRKLKQMGAIP